MFGKEMPVRRDPARLSLAGSSPWLAFHRDIDRIFERALGDLGAPLTLAESFGEYSPEIDVEEDEREIRVVAEIPGIDEKDIEVRVNHDHLTIRGKKEQEKEEKEASYYRRERSFGTFERVIALPCRVDEAKVEAHSRKGVLTIRLPKSAEEKETTRKIPVKGD